MGLERKWCEIEQFLAGLDGVRLRHEPSGRRWMLRNRLVARQLDEATLLIRADFERREELLNDDPTTFSVRPDLEAHMKVLADIAQGDLAVIKQALSAAWTLQRNSS